MCLSKRASTEGVENDFPSRAIVEYRHNKNIPSNNGVTTPFKFDVFHPYREWHSITGRREDFQRFSAKQEEQCPETIGLQPMELQLQPNKRRVSDTIGLQPMELQLQPNRSYLPRYHRASADGVSTST
jgi:hypothetical protein